MKSSFFLLLIAFVAENDGRLWESQRHQSPKPSGRYRISPTTGVRIALPSKLLVLGFSTMQLIYDLQHLNNCNGKRKN